jgi:hypothetical protein
MKDIALVALVVGIWALAVWIWGLKSVLVGQLSLSLTVLVAVILIALIRGIRERRGKE